MMGTESGFYTEIIVKLERLVKKEYALVASIGIQTSLGICFSIFFLFVFLEMIAHFPSVARTVLFFTLLLVSLFFLITRFIIPALNYFKLFRKTDYFKTALKIGNRFPFVKDDLLNAMELVSSEKAEKRYSLSLIDASFFSVYNKIKGLDFSSIVSFKKSKELFLYFIGIVLFCCLMLSFVPGLRAASYRMINFNREFIPPPAFIFEIEPGNSKVTKGNDLSISVKVTGKIPKEIFLAIKSNDETNFQLQQLSPGKPSGQPGINNIYHYEIPAVRTSFNYFAQAENIKSATYSIEVIDRPIIKALEINIISPSYSKIPSVQQKDNGNISALLGSDVELKIISTKNLIKAIVEFSDTTKKDLTVNENLAEGKFAVRKDIDYKIILTDENNNQNLSPIIYSVKALYDAFPSLDIIAPNRDVSLNNDNRLPLDVKISDDFGFTKLLLHYKLSSSKYEQPENNFKSLEIPINKNITEEEVNYIWNLSDLNLSSDDVVSYYLEIFDNDNISGPKSAKSSTFNIRVPSLAEILNQANDTQNESEKELQDTFKEAQDLKQRFSELNQELKQDKKNITWEEKQKIQQSMDQFKNLQEKVNNIGKKLEKTQNDLQQNNLLSKETLQKYMDLQKLFEEMSTDEMKKALEKLNDVIRNMDRKMTQDAMEKMQVNEDELKQSIERTMNLLKRIQVEQKVDELLKRTDQITKQQQEVQDKTGKTDQKDKSGKDQLSEKQDDITKDLNDYSKKLDDLSKRLDELKDLPKDQLEQIKKEFQNQKNENLSDQASNDIEQDQMKSAEQNQAQISQNMGNMKQQMEQFRKSIAQASQMQTLKNMMKITDNLITLSKQQEQLQSESKNMNPKSSEFDINAREQEKIKSNLDKIMQQMSALSQKTFAITPEMGASLGNAKSQMDNSLENLQNRNGNAASITQGQAMKSLNEAADMLKGSMEQMMKGGGQGGMMSLMEQLQQMAGQQMNLNNLTQMLQRSMNGQLSMQQQAELQRLGQQQDLIRKSVEQLDKESKMSGESKKIPADLNDIAKKMEEVVKNMTSEQLDDKTVQQQEHILSKLLDAQRSINQRDYEDKRESKSGKDIVGESPAELNQSSQKAKNSVRDELNKSVQEGYSKDYEELIRKYYEILQKENIKN